MTVNRCDGNVLVEFVFIAVMIMLPLCLMATSAYSLATNYLAMSNSVRSATRTLAVSENLQSGKQRAALIVRKQLQQAGLDPSAYQIQFTCSEQPCLTSGGFVTIRLSGNARLHTPFLDSVTMPLSVSQTMEVSGSQ